MRSIAIVSLTVCTLLLTAPAVRAEDHAGHSHGAEAAPAEKCEHGVKKSICTRCNPKLEPVFKAKGDWCPEHSVPESQCGKCHPDLAKQGVK